MKLRLSFSFFLIFFVAPAAFSQSSSSSKGFSQLDFDTIGESGAEDPGRVKKTSDPELEREEEPIFEERLKKSRALGSSPVIGKSGVPSSAKGRTLEKTRSSNPAVAGGSSASVVK